MYWTDWIAVIQKAANANKQSQVTLCVFNSNSYDRYILVISSGGNHVISPSDSYESYGSRPSSCQI